MNESAHKVDLLRKVNSEESCRYLIRFFCKLGYDRPNLVLNQHQELAFLFFSKHAMTSVTLWNIFWPKPNNEIIPELDNMVLPDFPSALILLRNQYESYLVLHYLTNNQIDDDEKRLRYLIWDRLSYLSRVKFGKYLQSDRKITEQFDKITNEKTRSLLKNRYYENIGSEDIKKRILNGSLAMLKTYNEIAREANVNENWHRLFYGYVNQYAHPNALGFDHLIKGNPAFLLKQAQSYYEEIACFMLDYIKSLIFAELIKGDEFIEILIDFHIEVMRNFDQINVARNRP